MLKSLITGAFAAFIIVAFAAISLTLLSPINSSNEPPVAPQTAVDDAPGVIVNEITPLAEAPTEEPAVELAPSAVVSQPDPETADNIADTTPLAAPETSTVETALNEPSEGRAPEIEAVPSETVLLAPRTSSPQAPITEQEAVVSTETAEPVQPNPVQIIAPKDADVGSEISVDEAVQDEPRIAVTENVTEDQTSALADSEVVLAEPAEDNQELAPELSEPIAEPVEPTIEVVEAQPTEEQQISIDAPQADDPETSADTQAESAPEEDEIGLSLGGTFDLEVPSPRLNSEKAEDQPSLLTLQSENGDALPGGDTGVRVNRVIVNDPEETPSVASEDEIVLTTALERNAAKFENGTEIPPVAIMLIHEGSLIDGIEKLARLPFPVTIILDGTLDSARSQMLAYRTAGSEVALSVQFPDGAQAADVEVLLQTALRNVPDAVAFVDTGETGFQDSRDVINQTVAVLAENGHGLVFEPKGLNSALRVAESAGIEASTIYRDLDSDGQSARVIGRFIDQAGFRARQENGVILLGRMRDETIDALVEWGAAERTSTVVMSPLSAVLLR